MIIEIKDLPNEQTIDKIDIHIDFQKGLALSTVTTPSKPSSSNKIPDVEYVLLSNSQSNSQNDKKPEVPNEMVNTEF